MSEAVYIVIGGDIIPVGKNEPHFINGDSATIFGGLLDEIKGSDLSIVNLEAPLISEETPIVKIGPVFGVDIKCINGLVNSGIDIVNLANNHILDHGATGLRMTLKVLRENNIQSFGAGENLEEASKICIVNVKGKRIGFLGMADREFSIAGEKTPGANPTDLIQFIRIIRRQRSELDYLIVLLHEGVQHFPFPTPELKKLCRFLVEEGADAVICQHSHCPGCYETYRGRPIVYGQGDLISDSQSYLKDDSGFLVKLVLNQQVSMSLIPYTQLYAGGIRSMTKEEKYVFLAELEQRNRVVKDPAALHSEWQNYSRALKDGYYAHIIGLNRLFRVLNRKVHIIDYISAKRAAILLNIVRCSAHRAAIEIIFSDILAEKIIGRR